MSSTPPSQYGRSSSSRSYGTGYSGNSYLNSGSNPSFTRTSRYHFGNNFPKPKGMSVDLAFKERMWKEEGVRLNVIDAFLIEQAKKK